LEYFNERYAELAADLADMLEEAQYGEVIDDLDLASVWTAQNDARGYAILGDPAVRLMVDRSGGGRPRMPLELSIPDPAPEPEPVEEPMPSDPPADDPNPHTDFGLFGFGKDKDEEEEEPGMLKRFATEVTQKLRATLTDLVSLEVRTFVADGRDMKKVSALPTPQLAEEATLKAYTRMALDGDLDSLVPRSSSKVDQALWDAHRQMVEQAQAHRMELIKAVLSLIKPDKQ
jgi:hypothetical protein